MGKARSKRFRRRKRVTSRKICKLAQTSPRIQPPPPARRWIGRSAVVPGLGHLSRGIPCQDEAATGMTPRPWLFAADGMGSSRSSQWGSSSVTDRLPELADTFDPFLRIALDGADGKRASLAWDSFVRWTYRNLVARQRSLAVEKGGKAKDYRYTLALGIVGRHRIGYLQVGDAEFLVRRDGKWEQPCHTRHKDFANRTSFVGCADELSKREGRGLIDARGVQGLLAFTDGVACQALGKKNQGPARALEAILEDAEKGDLDNGDLCGFLANPVWNSSTCDDRGLSLLCPLEKKPAEEEKERSAQGKKKLSGKLNFIPL